MNNLTRLMFAILCAFFVMLAMPEVFVEPFNAHKPWYLFLIASAGYFLCRVVVMLLFLTKNVMKR
ncbi:TPA: hypothetical protein SMO97_003545 [Proteus mirabilis]|nr:hypothetical protein [Proteus mirabilis]HEJ9413618.1 hypothetical protein [Proteus mirabilis]HEJ9438581.1 hypothetical protein [Proteus mirabilis]HEK0450271.1 hypothetical protein [Proteus mirabilis]HEK2727462.1 hypothetical protein [Proteus mirabilis]